MGTKAKKKAGKAKARKSPPIKRKARTPRLPGMEDAGIPALEKIAEEYADVRDQRIALSKREGEMQDDLLALMRKHNKPEYHHEDVHVWVKATEMKVKVKIGELTPAKAKKESEDTISASADEFADAVGEEVELEGDEENEPAEVA